MTCNRTSYRIKLVLCNLIIVILTSDLDPRDAPPSPLLQWKEDIMKRGKRILTIAVIFALLVSDSSVLATANTLTIPAGLQIIDEGAF